MLFTHFYSSEQRNDFHAWGSLQKIKKTKIEKRSPFLVQPS